MRQWGMAPNALDLSFDVLDADAIPADVSLVIQNVWDGIASPGPIIGNMLRALAAGKRIGAYCVINPAVADNVANALVWKSPEFCALDVEYYPKLSPAKLRDESDRLAAAHPEWPRIIYTSEEEWSRMIGGDTSFASDHYLWDARRDRPFTPYGGWTEDRVIGVQRTGTVQMGTSKVDYNDWRFDLMAQEEQQGYALKQHDLRMKMASAALNNDMNYLVALLVAASVLPSGTTAAKPAV